MVQTRPLLVSVQVDDTAALQTNPTPARRIRMAHPVRVGQPSRTFLEWNGTELICERGHVLLHVPEIPTSWFGAQRWVCLDGSWRFLFARPTG